MLKHQDIFYAKILLFGEYSVLLGSDALTVPYSYFNGAFSFVTDQNYTDRRVAEESNQSLARFLQFAREQNTQKAWPVKLDLKALEKDLQAGMFFESNIPQGYGLGSSGALIAAVYSKYAKHPVPVSSSLPPHQLDGLKQAFAKLESFYHGKSSGLDPLNAYIKTPLHVQAEQIRQIRIPVARQQKKGGIFLINTRQPRKTGPLVDYFLTHTQKGGSRHIDPEKLKAVTQKTLQAFLQADSKTFTDSVRELSRFQLHYMPPMIPEGYGDLWAYGLESGDYTIKLCGAGGGGFLLGFTNDLEKAEAAIDRQEKTMIPVFHYSQLESIQ